MLVITKGNSGDCLRLGKKSVPIEKKQQPEEGEGEGSGSKRHSREGHFLIKRKGKRKLVTGERKEGGESDRTLSAP